MCRMRFHCIGSIASGQFGLVTRKQALTVVTRRDLERALDCGSLYRVAQGVYAFAGVPPSWERLVMTAVLAAGEGARVSHGPAAVLWGVPGFEGRLRPPPEITVPHGRWPRLKGVVVHSSIQLADAHVGQLGAWPLTSVARTICDVASSVSRHALVSTLDQALVAGLVTLAEMTEMVEQMRGGGRRSLGGLPALLALRGGEYERADSRPEAVLHRWIVKAGLPVPVQQHPVTVDGHHYWIDLAYPDAAVFVEYDGWDTHRARSSFDNDRARRNRLASLGKVLVYTSTSTRGQVICDVATALQLDSSRFSTGGARNREETVGEALGRDARSAGRRRSRAS
jgi:hypothetical protein